MLIIHDTETTGLVKHPDAPLAKQPRVIEYGGVALSLKDGSVKARFKQLVNPGVPITSEITGITGITNEEVANAPTFDKAWPAISKFMRKGSAFLAHNEPFDHAVIDYELKRIGATFTWPPTFCTIGLYRDQWGRDMKLTELYQSVVGKELDQKHRADSDVDALVEIVQTAQLWRVLL